MSGCSAAASGSASAEPLPAAEKKEDPAAIEMLRSAIASRNRLDIVTALGSAPRSCSTAPASVLSDLLKEHAKRIVESLAERPAILAPQEYDALIPPIVEVLDAAALKALAPFFGSSAIDAAGSAVDPSLQALAVSNLLKRRWLKDASVLLERPQVVSALFSLPASPSPPSGAAGGETPPASVPLIRFVLSTLIKAGKWTALRPVLRRKTTAATIESTNETQEAPLLARKLIDELTAMGEEKIAFKLLKDASGSTTLDDHPALRRKLKATSIGGLLRLPARSVIASACFRDKESMDVLAKHVEDRVNTQGKTLPHVAATFFLAMERYQSFVADHAKKCEEFTATGDRKGLFAWFRQGERFLRDLDTAASQLYRRDGVPTGSGAFSSGGGGGPGGSPSSSPSFSFATYRSFLPAQHWSAAPGGTHEISASIARDNDNNGGNGDGGLTIAFDALSMQHKTTTEGPKSAAASAATSVLSVALPSFSGKVDSPFEVVMPLALKEDWEEEKNGDASFFTTAAPYRAELCDGCFFTLHRDHEGYQRLPHSLIVDVRTVEAAEAMVEEILLMVMTASSSSSSSSLLPALRLPSSTSTSTLSSSIEGKNFSEGEKGEGEDLLVVGLDTEWTSSLIQDESSASGGCAVMTLSVGGEKAWLVDLPAIDAQLQSLTTNTTDSEEAKTRLNAAFMRLLRPQDLHLPPRTATATATVTGRKIKTLLCVFGGGGQDLAVIYRSFPYLRPCFEKSRTISDAELKAIRIGRSTTTTTTATTNSAVLSDAAPSAVSGSSGGGGGGGGGIICLDLQALAVRVQRLDEEALSAAPSPSPSSSSALNYRQQKAQKREEKRRERLRKKELKKQALAAVATNGSNGADAVLTPAPAPADDAEEDDGGEGDDAEAEGAEETLGVAGATGATPKKSGLEAASSLRFPPHPWSFPSSGEGLLSVYTCQRPFNIKASIAEAGSPAFSGSPVSPFGPGSPLQPAAVLSADPSPGGLSGLTAAVLGGKGLHKYWQMSDWDLARPAPAQWLPGQREYASLDAFVLPLILVRLLHFLQTPLSMPLPLPVPLPSPSSSP